MKDPLGPTKPRNIRFDVALWARLEREAERQRRPVANLIHKILSDALDFFDEEREVLDLLREQRRAVLRRAIPPELPPGKRRKYRPRRL